MSMMLWSSSARRAALVAAAKPGVLVNPVRTNYLISGPPKNRVSVVEKLGLSAIMMVGILFTPMWVMAHLTDYQKGKQ